MTVAPLPIEREIPLAPLTTFGIGGRAQFFLRWETVEALQAALLWAKLEHHPVTVLGGGSNVLISDSGIPGLVVKAEGGAIRSVPSRPGRLEVDAGVSFDALVAFTVEKGLGGLECLSGIPGTVGAAPIQNIGAYGQELKDVLTEVHVLERGGGRLFRVPASECGLSYRSSHFKREWRDQYIVTGLTLELEAREEGRVTYPDLRRVFGGRLGVVPTPREVRQAVLEIRRQKGMVYDPSDPDSHSAGSFFTNPVIAEAELPAVQERVRQHSEQAIVPQYPAGPGLVKLSAAFLIEVAGFERGFRLGRAGLSSRHVLALVNRGGATALEVKALAEQIRSRVRDTLGVELEMEVRELGEANRPKDERWR